MSAQTWRSKAVAAVAAGLPADATLAERKALTRANRPTEFGQTAWRRRQWARARKAYLVKHGLALPMTPLERLILEATHGGRP